MTIDKAIETLRVHQNQWGSVHDYHMVMGALKGAASELEQVKRERDTATGQFRYEAKRNGENFQRAKTAEAENTRLSAELDQVKRERDNLGESLRDYARLEVLAQERAEAAEAENTRLQNEWDNCDEMLQSTRTENTRLSERLAEVEKVLEPFAEAARTVQALGPDGIDDGLTVVAYVHARREREVTLSTSDFSKALATLTEEPAR